MSLISDIDLILNELNMKPKGMGKIGSPTTLADRIERLEQDVEKIKVVIGDITTRQFVNKGMTIGVDYATQYVEPRLTVNGIVEEYKTLSKDTN
jgi:hypothetical protein